MPTSKISQRYEKVQNHTDLPEITLQQIEHFFAHYKDLENDIAVLKIYPRTPLPTVVLGDSDMVRVADRVLAVGSPFGLEQTVTAGIISDDSRDLVIEGQIYKDMIQTDAAINRGNSGGPLINMKGEVIGINTAIYAPTGVFTGVGFAIPINVVKPSVRTVAAR